MKVTHLEEAVKYSPPKHYDCFAMHLQHKNQGCEAPYWVGCSYAVSGLFGRGSLLDTSLIKYQKMHSFQPERMNGMRDWVAWPPER